MTDAGRRALITRGNRKHLTPKERVALWSKQSGLCGCGCGEALSNAEGTVGEHFWFVSLGNSEKPDALLRASCAKRKTYGGQDGEQWRAVGGDIRDIHHVKRLAEGRTQHDRRNERGAKLKSNAKLQSRGFSGWRDFAGNIKTKEPSRG